MHNISGLSLLATSPRSAQRMTNKLHSAEHHFKSEETPASRTDNPGPLKVRPQARESLRIPRTSRRSRAFPTHLRIPEGGNSCSRQGSQSRSGSRSDHAARGAPPNCIFAANKIARVGQGRVRGPDCEPTQLCSMQLHRSRYALLLRQHSARSAPRGGV